MSLGYRFNRLEMAGSLGDVGTLLPLAIGMIMINGLNPSGLFLAVGLFFIFSGIYYGVTAPVQPMKVVGAYAIATGMTASQITASGAWLAIFLLILGATGAIGLIGKYTPKPVVRGVQLSTGTLLMAQGVKFMVGSSKFQALQQAAEPYLRIQDLGTIPIGIVIGITGGILTFMLLDNKKLPAGLFVVLAGLALGLLFGTHEGFDKLRIGLYVPKILPFGLPSGADFTFVLLVLVLPQIPMTLGNAVIANADLSKQYFGEDSKKVTYRALCITMGLANILAFFVGGDAPLSRRGRPCRPLSLRCPDGGVKSDDWIGFCAAGPVVWTPCPGPCLFAAHVCSRSFAGVCRQPTGADDRRHEREERPLCRSRHAGHYAGLKPRRWIHGGHSSGVCAKIRKN